MKLRKYLIPIYKTTKKEGGTNFLPSLEYVGNVRVFFFLLCRGSRVYEAWSIIRMDLFSFSLRFLVHDPVFGYCANTNWWCAYITIGVFWTIVGYVIKQFRNPETSTIVYGCKIATTEKILSKLRRIFFFII